MDNVDFAYRRQARQLPVYLGFGGGLALFYLETHLSLPFWGQVSIWGFLGLVVWQLVANRSAEMRITQGWMEIYRDGRELGRFALNHLDRVQIRKRPLWGADIVLHLSDGRRVDVPADAVPPLRRLRAVLQARGVAVR